MKALVTNGNGYIGSHIVECFQDHAEAGVSGNLATTICQLAGLHSKIKHAAKRPGGGRHSLAVTDKLRPAGFTPAGNFHERLEGTIESFKGKAQPCHSSK